MHEHTDVDGRTPASEPNPWGLNRARVISLVSQKGGVGKTTSTINIGAAFALSGHRVLIIGADPQCGVSRSLGFRPEQLRGGLRDVILSGIGMDEVAHDTTLDGLQMVVPDSWTLEEEREYKGLMETHPGIFVDAMDAARDEWDTILIDCPPGFGPETRAAVAASDAYLVPVQAEELSRASLKRLLEFVRDYSAAVDMPAPKLEGLFMTMTDHRTLLSRHVAESLDAEYGSDLLDRSVPRTTRLAEMALQGRPTVIYDRRSAGSRAYFDLVDEVMLRWLKRDEAAETVEERPASTVLRAMAAADGGPDSFLTPGLPEAMHAESAAEETEDMGGGLAQLLRDITGGGSRPAAEHLEAAPASSGSWQEPMGDPVGEPDMVSLDDLLEEEETGGRGRSRDSDREGYWGLSDDDYDTIN